MLTLNDLKDAQYINIESFRKNGTGVKTPVWQTPENGKLYAWTQAGSYKVKRIRRNPSVNVCACDQRGEPKSEWVAATARVLDSAEAEKAQRKRMAKKYGAMFHMFRMYGTFRRAEYVVLEISPA